MTVKSLRKQLAAAIAMTLVATVALGSSTYAWFVNNTKVTAETVQVTAKAANTLLISETGAANWKTTLPITTDLTEMVPVSTVGSAGEALTFVKDTEWTMDTTDNKDYASTFAAATANTDYYATDFDIKCSVAGTKLYLDTETTFQMGVDDNNTPEDTTDDITANEDVLATLRLGLVVDGKTYIYQIDGNNLVSTYDTSINAATDVNGIAKAIDSTGAAADITVNNASGGVGVLPLATTPTSGTAFVSATNGADLLYTFQNADEVVNIKVYIWMEGCDYDCNSAMVSTITAQKVLATLGFAVSNT